MTEALRNHWSYVASATVRASVALAFVFLVAMASAGELRWDRYAGIVVGSSLMALIVSAVVWKRTEYRFLEDEIVVTRSTVFRSETRVQYDRLASVNVERDFVCRILGATRLSFNLNSSVNPGSAEAQIVLRADEAEALRQELAGRMFGIRSEDRAEDADESLVRVGVLDIFLHSILGMPSWRLGFGMAMLAYSVASFVFAGDLSIVSTLLFAVDFFVPAVGSFTRLYGYRVVRSGDAVSVSSGLFSTRRDSFLLSKVNCVRMREPLVCRLMGRAMLEVEVVGTSDGKGAPLLCPLKPRRVAEDLLRDLLPEFECSAETVGQRPVSLVGICARAGVAAAASIAVVYRVSEGLPELARYAPFLYAIIAILCAAWAWQAYRVRRFACDGDIALLVTGACDRTTSSILLDKIQSVEVRSSPVQRSRGAASCRLSLLSSAGATVLESGVFPVGMLESLSSTVMDRIRDGRYDFRRFQRCCTRDSARTSYVYIEEQTLTTQNSR